MNKKLYVGNLPYNTTEDQLRDMVGQFGAIASARIITDKLSGRSKGFGFVEMASEEEAERAISELNGKDFDGRAIIVNEAKTEQPRRPSSGRDGGYGYNNDRGGGGYRRREDRGPPRRRSTPPANRGGGGFDDDNFGNR